MFTFQTSFGGKKITGTEMNYSYNPPKFTPQNLINDHSTLALIISNVITIFLAVTENWSLLTLMWIYLFQSIIIGIFNVIKIMDLKDFSTEGFLVNDHTVEPTESTKISTALFFAFHYGFFHFIYAIFLSTNTNPTQNPVNFESVFMAAIIFFINHLYSYIYNKGKDTSKKNIGTIMFFPYARIVPMHTMIMIGGLIGQSHLVVFLILKTFADVIMHEVEHAPVQIPTTPVSPAPQENVLN